MNRTSLVTIAVLVAGTACIALARQQKTARAEQAAWQAVPARKIVKTTATGAVDPRDELGTRDEGNEIIKDTVTGREGDKIYWATFERIQPLIKQGRAAMAQKKYVRAEQAFRQALAIQPQDATSWLLLGETCDQDSSAKSAALPNTKEARRLL